MIHFLSSHEEKQIQFSEFVYIDQPLLMAKAEKDRVEGEAFDYKFF